MNLTERTFNRLALSAIIGGFALLVLAFGAGILTLTYAQRSNERVDHTYQVMEQLAEVDVWVERAETASRGYLLVPDPLRATAFRENVDRIAPSIDRLASLTADNPIQRRNTFILRDRIDREVTTLESIMRKALAGEMSSARDEFAREVGKRRVIAIRATTATMRAEEQRLLTERTATEQATSAASRNVLALTGVLLLLIGIGAVWLVRRYTIDLTRARDRLDELNSNLEGAVLERTADLQRANEEIQRFAYIVSHDLRAPLVNIMGFTAELEDATRLLGDFVTNAHEQSRDVPEPVRLAAQEDLPEATRFIRSSTQKMDRLINAILRLAREGRRSLNPELLPINTLVKSVTDSLEIQVAARGATIEVQNDLPNIFNDRVAVEQLFSNLLENAVKYLDPARAGRIVVRGAQHGDRIVFEVIDNGRGIDPRDHQRIFDLFRRSGAQDQAGEGIGLAHTRALAYRLGGTISCTSKLGEGANFSLNLPVTYAGERIES